MSLDATRWAWAQQQAKGTTKLVLLSLADRADESHICYPSITRLTADTGMNRKTIMRSLKHLEELGLIQSSKQLGRFNSYRLLGVSDRHATSTKIGTGTKIGTSTKIGTGPVPNLGLVPVPKLVPKPTNEPTKNLKSPPKPPQGGLPEWLNREDWTAFKEHRRRLKKPMTPRSETLNLNKLVALKDQGHDPTDIINLAIEKGWQSFYPPKSNGKDPYAEFR